MVANALTDELIASGKSFVNKLDDSNTKVNAAFWLLSPEHNFWQLMISLRGAEKDGPKKTYTKIQRAISKIEKPSSLSLDDVTLLKSSTPILKLMKTAVRTGPEVSGIRFTNNVINGQLIPGAYIYRI